MTGMKSENILENERGSALVLVMIIMAVLSIIGISSVNNTSTELTIVRNERLFQENFYQAESAAQEGAQQLEITAETILDDRDFQLSWLKSETLADVNNYTVPSMTVPTAWSVGTNSSASVISAGLRGTIQFSVLEGGIAQGASLDMSQGSNLYDYTVRGMSDDTTNGNGYVIIEVGYKKRH